VNLLEAVSSLAARHLGERQFERLRATYRGTRKTLAPAMRRLYGTFTADELREHLEKRLPCDFEVLMVHSSVNHMQPMYVGDPLQFVRMLIDFCGPERTLAMPAFYFGDPAVGGVRDTFERNPVFDLRRTPSQMGLATELFRRSRGVASSRHPVYRISALGPLAADLTRGHEYAETPSGKGTPFDQMTKYRTLILGIGKPFEVLTQVHHAEDLLGDRFPVPRGPRARPIQMTLVEGKTEVPFELRGQGTIRGRRNMWRLRRIMSRERLKEWRFHRVPMFSAWAEHVTQDIMAAAERGLTLYE
jgi:aminoglycoside N3'-acetyltransferase